MKINEADADYETVRIYQIGTIDSLTDVVVFKDETVEFAMPGVSSEVAGCISDFFRGKMR